MGHMGNGVQGYGAHGQWGTGGMAYRGMGPIDNGTHGQLGTGMGYPVMGNGVQG